VYEVWRHGGWYGSSFAAIIGIMTNSGVSIAFFALAVPSLAQWLSRPTPGIPRTADGKANLAASAPKTADGKPDLAGLWRLGVEIGISANITAGLASGDIQPWAAALSRQRLEDFGKDDPEITGCKPGGPRHITHGGLTKILQTPGLIVMLYEDLSYRQIFLDGRQLPLDPNPSWMGYSVGHWEGDALVVESAGFNDRTWLDFAGHPHTEALKITERYRRREFGHMDLQITLEDPAAYAKPWTVSAGGALAADTELIEYVCAENEKDRAHLVGRTSAEKKVTVAPEILAKYVGIYEVRSPNQFDGLVGRNVFSVTLADGELFIDLQGKGKVPMIPLSETLFSPRLLGTYEFVKDDKGEVAYMLVHSAEEVLKAVRRK
jgi:hypothetical protein